MSRLLEEEQTPRAVLRLLHTGITCQRFKGCVPVRVPPPSVRAVIHKGFHSRTPHPFVFGSVAGSAFTLIMVQGSHLPNASSEWPPQSAVTFELTGVLTLGVSLHSAQQQGSVAQSGGHCPQAVSALLFF